ncbi:cytochrome P450 [Micromonospora sp. NPDC048935]|uniref:cytochrome P450 family protein n=1 Tax=Micromonospora sp. NPDC048935 TaxID=3364262 RepID=UPI0037194850
MTQRDGYRTAAVARSGDVTTIGTVEARRDEGAFDSDLGLEQPLPPGVIVSAKEPSPISSPAFQHDPYPTYAWLRDNQPVCPVMPGAGGKQSWLVSRYEDARSALRNPALSKDIRRLDAADRAELFPNEELHHHMLNLEAPDHTRLRRLVTKAFTPRQFERLRPRVQQVTTDLVERLEGKREADLIDELALPLPMTMIYEILGVPAEDRDKFRRWVNIATAGPLMGDAFPPALASLSEYVQELVADKHKSRTDDLLSALIMVHEDGDKLAEHELVAMTFLLLAAGYETTVNLIGNGLYHLLANPDQMELLRRDRSLLPSAVEEILRFESPVQNTTLRMCTEPTEIGGEYIEEDEVVLISLGSAHRDAEHFPDPDRFDVTRADNPHLAFGYGHHYCMGAPLARMEGEIAIGAVLDRFPDLKLAVEPDEVRWRPGLIMRGLQGLPVTL